MPKTVKNDITGKKFARLTAIRFIPDEGRHAKFLFSCECGAEKIIMAQSVISGLTKSCGCFYQEQKNDPVIHGHSGKNRTKTYNSWAGMMDRCEWGGHPKAYKFYGLVGIRVCERWHEYKNFLADMGERPPGTSIDRINNDEGYYPGNCRWATRAEQSMNTSLTLKVIVSGEIVNVRDLCKERGISMPAVRARAWRRGKDFCEALRSMGVECDPAPTPLIKLARKEAYA